ASYQVGQWSLAAGGPLTPVVVGAARVLNSDHVQSLGVFVKTSRHKPCPGFNDRAFVSHLSSGAAHGCIVRVGRGGGLRRCESGSSCSGFGVVKRGGLLTTACSGRALRARPLRSTEGRAADAARWEGRKRLQGKSHSWWVP